MYDMTLSVCVRKQGSAHRVRKGMTKEPMNQLTGTPTGQTGASGASK